MKILLRYFRLRAGMTQKELAEASGISQAVVSRIENGKDYPSIDTLEKLCKVLYIKAADILRD